MIFADKAEYRAQLLYGHNVIINMLQTKVNPDQICDDWQLKLYPLNAPLAEIIRFWRPRFRYCDAVIYTPEGALNQSEQKAASDRDVKFRTPLLDLDGVGTHSFRKLFATELFRRTDLLTTSMALLHSNINTTVRYLAKNPHLDSALEECGSKLLNIEVKHK
jgi:integrase